MKAVFNVHDDVYFHYYSIIEKQSMAITLRGEWFYKQMQALVDYKQNEQGWKHC